MTSPSAVVGGILRKHRKAQELPLRRVAVRLDLSVAYISELETGHKQLTPDLVVQYCAALKLSNGTCENLLRRLGYLPPDFQSLVLTEPRLITAASSVMAYFRRELDDDGLLAAIKTLRGDGT